MLYNDWQRTTSLTSWKQLSWSVLHFPFHLATVLFIGGSAQLIMWWKICEINRESAFLVTVGDDLLGIEVGLQDKSREQILDGVNTTVDWIFKRWPPHYESTRSHYDSFYASLGNLSDAAWNNITNPPENITADNLSTMPGIMDFVDLTSSITITVENSLFATFHVDSIADADTSQDADTFEANVFQANSDRLDLVVSLLSELSPESTIEHVLTHPSQLTYTFVSAGVTLVLMTALFSLGRIKHWNLFNLIRVSITILIAIGLALISLVFYNEEDASEYGYSPWMLPTFCLAFFFLLIMYSVPRSILGSAMRVYPQNTLEDTRAGDVEGDREKLAGASVLVPERARLEEECKSCSGRQDSSVSGGSHATSNVDGPGSAKDRNQSTRCEVNPPRLASRPARPGGQGTEVGVRVYGQH